MSQSIARWNGLDVQVSARMSRTPGISPDVGTLVWRKGTTQPALQEGTLQFLHGGSVIDTWTAARIVFVREFRDRYINIEYRVEDRRWKWRWATVTGWYNVRDAKGEVVTSTKKTPRELMVILLQSLGEVSYDVSVIPNTDDILPEVRWQYASSIEAISGMLSLFGCDIHLLPNNSVSVIRAGVGSLPSTTGAREIPDYGMSVPYGPSQIVAAASGNLFEDWIKLRAIGYEPNGERKLAESLSYRPEGGFRDLVNFRDVENVASVAAMAVKDRERILQLCKRTIYRLYEVDVWGTNALSFKSAFFQAPYDAIAVKKQILPLVNHRLVTEEDPDGTKKYAAAEVMGDFVSHSNANVRGFQSRIWSGGFSIDCEDGIVSLSEPAWRYGATDSDPFREALLFLRCGHVIRNVDYGPEMLRIFTVNTGIPGGVGKDVVRRTDLAALYIQEYNNEYSHTVMTTTDVVSTEEVIDDELQKTAEERALQFVATREPITINYTPIVQYATSGVITQVTHQVGVGKSGITTVSVYGEHDASQVPAVVKARNDRVKKDLEAKQLDFGKESAKLRDLVLVARSNNPG